jgi:hypothetical protein
VRSQTCSRLLVGRLACQFGTLVSGAPFLRAVFHPNIQRPQYAVRRGCPHSVVAVR